MAAFRAAFLNELEKLYKKRKALVAFILSVVVIVVGQIAIIGVRSGFGLRGVGSQEFPVMVLSLVANTILPLFTALIVIDCFSGEFAHNQMRITLTRPVSRLKIFTAKIAAIAAFVLTNLIFLFILSALAGFLFNDNSASLASFVRTLLAYLSTVCPLLVLALLVVLLSNLFKNGNSVFFASILLFLAFKAAEVFFSAYASLLITSHLDWYQLWLAVSLPGGKILRQFLLMAGYAIMLFTAAYYLFDKRDY